MHAKVLSQLNLFLREGFSDYMIVTYSVKICLDAFVLRATTVSTFPQLLSKIYTVSSDQLVAVKGHLDLILNNYDKCYISLSSIKDYERR